MLTVDWFEWLQLAVPTIRKCMRLLNFNPTMLFECISVLGCVTLTNFGWRWLWDTLFMPFLHEKCMGPSFLSIFLKQVKCFLLSSLKYRLFCLLERIGWSWWFYGLKCPARGSALYTVAVYLSLKTCLRLWFSPCYHCKIDGSLLVCCSLQWRM